MCFSNWNIVFSFCLRQAVALLFHFKLIASVNSFKSFYWNFKLLYAAKISYESTVDHIPNQLNGEAESKFYHHVCVRGGLSLAQPYIYGAKKIVYFGIQSWRSSDKVCTSIGSGESTLCWNFFAFCVVHAWEFGLLPNENQNLGALCLLCLAQKENLRRN